MQLFKRKIKPLLPPSEQKKVTDAIRAAELITDGEVRVYIESRNSYMNPVDRARELFFGLQMDKTDDRNAVLIYVAVKDREVAIYGDEAIHREVGQEYWDKAVKEMIALFSQNELAAGLVKCVEKVGATLHEKFPWHNEDKNELPDDIVFGR